jgi:O-antigen/teichoic acid export membrane protein
MMQPRRVKTLMKGVSYSWLEYLINIVIPIITMPIAYRYFGIEIFGIWLVIMSFVAFLQYSDFGINVSSQNQISKSSSIHKQAEIIKKSLAILFGISITIIILSIGAFYFIDNWVLLLGKIPIELKGKAETITIIMVLYFSISLPLKLSLSIFTAFQKIHVASIYRILSRLIQAISLLSIIILKGDLILYSLFICVGQILLSLISFVHLGVTNHELSKLIFQSSTNMIRYQDLISNGFRFLNLSISTMIILNAGNIIISHAIGPQMVPLYAITFRLFFMGIQLTNSIGVVLWPLYSKAAGNSEWEWIDSTYNMSMIIHTRLGAALWIGGVLFAEQIIRLWVGDELFPGRVFIYTIGAWSFLTSYAGGAISLLNAIGPTVTQVLIQWFYTAIYLVSTIALIRYIGINGVPLGLFIGVLIAYSLVPKKYVTKRTEGKVQLNQENILLHLFFVLLPSLLTILFITNSFNADYNIVYSLGLFIVFMIASVVSLPSETKSFIYTTVFNTRRVTNNKNNILG